MWKRFGANEIDSINHSKSCLYLRGCCTSGAIEKYAALRSASAKSVKYCSRLKAVIDEKYLALSSRSGVVYHTLLTDSIEIGPAWMGSATALAILTWTCTLELPIISTSKNSVKGKILWKTVKTPKTSSSPRTLPSSRRMESWNWLSGGERHWKNYVYFVE